MAKESAFGSAVVGVVMGSASDHDTLRPALEILAEFGVPYESRIVSAHRTPDLLFEYASTAEGRGLRVLIAGAGGAAHLPGMLAAKTLLPVLGVPIPSTALNGLDSLLSMVQMPKGVPVGTLAIGKPGAANAALLAISILATTDDGLRDRLRGWRSARAEEVLSQGLPATGQGLPATSQGLPATSHNSRATSRDLRAASRGPSAASQRLAAAELKK